MPKGKSFSAKIAKGKQASMRFNAAGEEITTVRILRPQEVEGKPGVYRYRAVMVDVVASEEKELYR